MDSTALVLCLFSLLCQALGDVREKTLYVETGTDLILDVGEHVTLKEKMSWKFSSEVNIVRLIDTSVTVHQNYSGRAELSQNQSLLLKNVQKNDSGEYRAVVSGIRDRVLVKYQVTVLDPVSDLKLKKKHCGSDWPDLILACITLDGLLSSTFICNETTCSHERGEPTLKVYLKNGSVTCHHSNQVSSKNDTKAIEELCSEVSDAGSPASIGFIFLIIFVVICAAAAAAAVVIYRCCRKKGVILENHLNPLQPNEDGGEATETTGLQPLCENEPREPGPSNGAQGYTKKRPMGQGALPRSKSHIVRNPSNQRRENKATQGARSKSFIV